MHTILHCKLISILFIVIIMFLVFCWCCSCECVCVCVRRKNIHAFNYLFELFADKCVLRGVDCFLSLCLSSSAVPVALVFTVLIVAAIVASFHAHISISIGIWNAIDKRHIRTQHTNQLCIFSFCEFINNNWKTKKKKQNETNVEMIVF